MIKINGKFTDAIIYADIVGENTIEQIKNLIDQEFMEGLNIKVMPDCHAGKGCVIGTTIEIKDKVVPNLVGVDIGCGMLCVKLGKMELDFKELDEFIKNNIPSGCNVNSSIVDSLVDIKDLICYLDLKKVDHLKKSLGSLGGGNHFIEIDKNDKGEYYLIIHSGSRNLGKQVAEIYQEKAITYHENKILNKKEEVKGVITEYKILGLEKMIQTEIKRISKFEIKLPIPKELCYLEGKDFLDYMHDIKICQRFASLNRYEIARRIVSFLGLDMQGLEYFETIHNYINMKDNILRKGAISAYENEIVLIPINMRDGCIIAKGKSNKAYNYSAPHGAGRMLSRLKAKKEISLKDFKESMQGIYSSTINENTLDESPFAYKPIESILENIKDTVEIIEIIKPVYNFKAYE